MNAVMKQEPERQINWFDLGRFGVALRVLPHSPLRGNALTVLEIRDQALYQSAVGWHEGMSDAVRRSLRESLAGTMRDLGFGELPSYIPDPDRPGYKFLRFYSGRQSLSLREIKRLVPGAEVTDLRPMPVNEVAIRPNLDPEVGVPWEGFIESTLKRESEGVWMPKKSAFDSPWADAPRIPDLRPTGDAINHNFRHVESGSLPGRLDAAGYRANALIGFYASKAAAVADGHGASDLEQVDLPYAAPLWVTRGGQVVAVKDVRYCPEIMGEHPSLLYGTNLKGGLAVAALRDIAALKPWLDVRVDEWLEQMADETKRPDLGTLWQSLDEAVTRIVEVGDAHTKLYGVVGLVEKSDASAEAARPTLPLEKMDHYFAAQLSHAVERLADLSTERAQALTLALIGLIEHGKGLMAEHVLQSARQAIKVAAEQVRDTDPVVSTEAIDRVRIEDVGEKIGGARKDYAKRAMTIDDLEVMNQNEREALVTKANVWAPLDYEAMRENGVTPQAAMAIKVLKDSLATCPDRGRGGDVDATYVQAIGLARDHMAEVKTMEDFGKALAGLYEAGLDTPNEPRHWKVWSTPIQFQWGRKAATDICEGGTDRFGYGAPIPHAVSRAIRKYVGSVADEADGKGSWGYLIRGGRSLTPEEKAERDAKARQNEELHRPHLDKVEREGQDWRGGRDVAAEDLLVQFGFRGVEFGNWLPQDERQEVVNMAYDSLMDLSRALDLPPKALSFDGRLAIAFGARGTGGKGAALAHYEPAREVINLTRMKGAGALAHEWFHGLDWHMGDCKRYASEMPEQRVGTLGAAVVPLARSLLRRGVTMEELDATTSANIDRTMTNIAGWAASPKAPREAMADLVKIETNALREKFYDIAHNQLDQQRNLPNFATSGLNNRGYGAITTMRVNDEIDDMMDRLKDRHPERKMFTQYKSQIRGNVAFLVANMAASATIDALRDLNLPMPQTFSDANARDTQYLSDAKKLDKQRGSAYWATTRELFARAGAAYVNDRLESLDARSDYLVYGSDEARHLDHPVGNPNPAGADRQQFNGLFDRLMAEYRLRVVNEASTGSDHPEP